MEIVDEGQFTQSMKYGNLLNVIHRRKQNQPHSWISLSPIETLKFVYFIQGICDKRASGSDQPAINELFYTPRFRSLASQQEGRAINAV